MTVIESPASLGRPHSPAGAGSAVLIVDAPNIDATIGNTILGGRVPQASERPQFAVLRQWFIGSDEPRDCAATLFTNVPAKPQARLTRLGWIQSLKQYGYSVFVKPKLHEDDDIDSDMVTFLEDCRSSGRLTRVVICSGDARLLLGPLTELAARGVEVTVAAFVESAGRLAFEESIAFIDLEQIPGVFLMPLPRRLNLLDIPPDGAWV